MDSKEIKIKLERWVSIKSKMGDYLKGAEIFVTASLVTDDGLGTTIAEGSTMATLGEEVKILEVLDAMAFTTESETGIRMWRKAVERLYQNLRSKQACFASQETLVVKELEAVSALETVLPGDL